MAHVYKGEPDERQAENITPSRFRPRYRELTNEEKALHDLIKNKAQDLEEIYNVVKDGEPSRYKSLAITALEESIMWIVKDLTS